MVNPAFRSWQLRPSEHAPTTAYLGRQFPGDAEQLFLFGVSMRPILMTNVEQFLGVHLSGVLCRIGDDGAERPASLNVHAAALMRAAAGAAYPRPCPTQELYRHEGTPQQQQVIVGCAALLRLQPPVPAQLRVPPFEDVDEGV